MNRRRFLSSTLAASLGPLAATYLPAALRAEAKGADGAEVLEPELQKKLAADVLRPQFHLLPRHNWMNDPCAPRFYQGEYHMFFQYNPHAAVWGDMHWNHAMSFDMIHWKHEPLALAPTEGGYDAYGCFTGSVLPGMDKPAILYTGVTKCAPEQETIRGEGTREVQCLAVASDAGLRQWQKLDKPVIEAPPAGVKVTGFRDPCPWKEGDTWYLIVGSGFDKVGGAVLLYTSKDGYKWTYLHPLAQGTWNGGSQTNPVDTGEMWECPDFFPLGDRHVLLYSTERKVYWEVGTLDRAEMRFHSEEKGLLDHGSYYAMKSMVDAKGRRILWGWVEETRSPEACVQAGWAGCMALPRVLTLGEDHRLRMEVPAEVAKLRLGERPLSYGAHDRAQTTVPLPGRAVEVVYALRVKDKPCGFALRHRGGGEALLTVGYAGSAGGDTQKPVLQVSWRSLGSAGEESQKKELELAPDATEYSRLRMWLDGSVIEIFVDGREALTLRNYAKGDLDLVLTGGKEAVHGLNAYAVKAISGDRLTT